MAAAHIDPTNFHLKEYEKYNQKYIATFNFTQDSLDGLKKFYDGYGLPTFILNVFCGRASRTRLLMILRPELYRFIPFGEDATILLGPNLNLYNGHQKEDDVGEINPFLPGLDNFKTFNEQNPGYNFDLKNIVTGDANKPITFLGWLIKHSQLPEITAEKSQFANKECQELTAHEKELYNNLREAFFKREVNTFRDELYNYLSSQYILPPDIPKKTEGETYVAYLSKYTEGFSSNNLTAVRGFGIKHEERDYYQDHEVPPPPGGGASRIPTGSYEIYRTDHNPEIDEYKGFRTIMDFNSTHRLNLESTRRNIHKYLQEVYSITEHEQNVKIYFHFPYGKVTTTVHFHVRINQAQNIVERHKSIFLDDIIERIDRETIDNIIMTKRGGTVRQCLAPLGHVLTEREGYITETVHFMEESGDRDCKKRYNRLFNELKIIQNPYYIEGFTKDTDIREIGKFDRDEFIFELSKFSIIESVGKKKSIVNESKRKDFFLCPKGSDTPFNINHIPIYNLDKTPTVEGARKKNASIKGKAKFKGRRSLKAGKKKRKKEKGSLKAGKKKGKKGSHKVKGK